MTDTGTPISFFAEIQGRGEQFRHECETRWVASFDTDAKRAVYLAGVWDKRGEAAAKKLRSDVWDELKRQERAVEPLQESLL